MKKTFIALGFLALIICGNSWGATDSLGYTSEVSYIAPVANYCDCVEAQATSSGTLCSLWVYMKTGGYGSIKLGLYSDSTTTLVGHKLWADPTGVATATGWVKIATGEAAIESGTYYWLCMKLSSSSDIVYYQTGASGINRFKAQTYTDAWSDPMGTLGSATVYAYSLLAVYILPSGEVKKLPFIKR